MTPRDRIRLTPSVPVLNATLEVWKRVGKEHNLGPVVGQSMRPLLHEGDLLRVRYGSAGARRGDIVVFRRQDTWIAHRVLRVDRHAGEIVFWPKGDNTGHWDGPLGDHDVIGRVLGVRRGDRYLALDTPPGRWLGVLVAQGSLVGNAVASRARRAKRLLLADRPIPARRWLSRSRRGVGQAAHRILLAIAWRWKGPGAR
ncbi:MAG TPA: S26 family signal peptidase [Candidatus Methylomirabilis sp.]|nr:S26 family signal peptidase [Candidatus Methylomirabilis sp.]